jgi:hypothetical protein
MHEYCCSLTILFIDRCLSKLPFAKDARAILNETNDEKKNFLRIRIFDVNHFSSQLAMKYNFQVLDLHYLVRQHVQHRCQDGMHYDATMHRTITTHIARYIACGFYQTLSKINCQQEDIVRICSDLLQSMIDKLDCKLTNNDRTIVEHYRQIGHHRSTMLSSQLTDKEQCLLYLIDHYESHSCLM